MNQIQAMRDTIHLMEQGLRSFTPRQEGFIQRLDKDLQPAHLLDMLAQMEKNDNPQHMGKVFSQAKLGRWLGWAQAAVVVMGLATLDEVKTINKLNAR